MMSPQRIKAMRKEEKGRSQKGRELKGGEEKRIEENRIEEKRLIYCLSLVIYRFCIAMPLHAWITW